ncbi:C10 family peptidase [Prevotellamassilia timonensis]|uniref:C10 family peptidase n=1 Tax=Prevotellamassilia timonensis TaxID=1852370 RepID=UPI003078E255
MKRHTLLLFLLLMAMPVLAENRSFRQAREIAERHAAKNGAHIGLQSVKRAKVLNKQQSTTSSRGYYVFPHDGNCGYTIVSGDDRMPEIVGYSTTDTYSEENMPDGMKYLMQAYEAMATALANGDAKAERCLAEKEALAVDSTYRQPRVAPLLADVAWGQSEPYNNLCPMYDGQRRTVTGCVATAMAQLMMYYKYPQTLKSDIPAYQTETYQLDMPSVSAGERYDWDNMLPQYSGSAYTAAQANAVAKLMYHCGLSVKADYGPETGTNCTPDVLVKYWGYDPDVIKQLYRENFSLRRWTAILDAELRASRPVLYGGVSTTSGGHAFLCDGTDGDGLYHINWGWSGWSNGYFDITILNSDYSGTESATAPADGFNYSCDMIVGIMPDNGVADAPLIETPLLKALENEGIGCELLTTERADTSGSFRLSITAKFENDEETAFEGYAGVCLEDEDGVCTLLSARKIYLDGRVGNRVYYVPLTFGVDYSFPKGRSRIYHVYTTDDGETWTQCGFVNKAFYEFDATDTTLRMVEDTLSASLANVDEFVEGYDAKFNLTASTTACSEQKIMLYVYGSQTPDKPSEYAQCLYVNIPAKGHVTRRFALRPPSAGDLYVWVCDEDGHELVSAQKFVVAESQAPILTLASKEVNTTAGDFETEYAYFFSHHLAVPRVNADEAIVTYDVRNDGGLCYAYAELLSVAFNSSTPDGVYSSQSKRVKLPGNGTVTTLSYTLPLADYEDLRSVRCYLTLYNSSESSEIMDLDVSEIPEVKYYMIDSPNRYWIQRGPALIFYIAGAPVGVHHIQVSGNSLTVQGGHGCMVLMSEMPRQVGIYNLQGQCIKYVAVGAGQQQNISLPSGIYVVEGKKVIVY